MAGIDMGMPGTALTGGLKTPKLRKPALKKPKMKPPTIKLPSVKQAAGVGTKKKTKVNGAGLSAFTPSLPGPLKPPKLGG